MFTTVLTFVGGMIASVTIYKIISIVKKEHIKRKAFITDAKRLKDKMCFMEMEVSWLKSRTDNLEKLSFKLCNLELEVKSIKSKLENKENK
ncbi:hypothetical protein [Bacillus sp. JUb91]|uniref:hypothetical protein n=1 Tax=Bacillus sp. JUb91 TaxID=2940596 RepID=UPI002167148C|nr:hypothetical protein [Bacillus sp. JUb91]MCS3600134.1 hypothetical protein [Bacillus sp. JUb91]